MKFWQVDAFTSEPFCGNPAAVFCFEEEPAEELLGKIAREMNLSETAFVIIGATTKIRWFTPNSEVDLCGHATLAAAHILWQERLISENEISFQSRSGELKVVRKQSGYTLNFPLQAPIEKPDYSEIISRLLDGREVNFIGSNGEDCLVVLAKDTDLFSFTSSPSIICELPERGIVLTSRDSSGKRDYLYRAFYPKLDVPEDPVTGSANTCLAPYWAKQIGRSSLSARQVSKRGGDLLLDVLDDRVLITGEAITVCEGTLYVPFAKGVEA